MSALIFDGTIVHELLEHSRKAASHRTPYEPGVDSGPGLFLVKDAGIYLMSNGEPGLMVEGLSSNKAHTLSRHKVVYADTYDADAEYDHIRAAAGGDDFAELVPDGDIFHPLKDGTYDVKINLTPTRMTTTLVRKKLRDAKQGGLKP